MHLIRNSINRNQKNHKTIIRTKKDGAIRYGLLRLFYALGNYVLLHKSSLDKETHSCEKNIGFAGRGQGREFAKVNLLFLLRNP